MNNSASVISEAKLRRFFEAEDEGKMKIDYCGTMEVEGFLYELYEDTRTGKRYAVRMIRTVHMGFNSNEDGKVEELVSVIEREGTCKASWGVTGRTMHLMLANKLAEMLPQYDWDIDYDRYHCQGMKPNRVAE